MAALLALLVALPWLARVLPADAGAPPGLLARVQASEDVAWSGLGESTGALALPDVRELGVVPELLGGTTRARTWWRGPTAYRVDVVDATGELDLVVDAAGAWTWDSEEDRAVRLQGEAAVRLPRGADLVAPLLGRRLARTPGVQVRPLPGRRVAGERTAGLRLVPPAGSPTTVAHVDVWAEPRTGPPLRVEVAARGLDRPVLQSELLDLSFERPELVRVAFGPPPTAEVQRVEAPDVAARLDRFAPFLLPETLAGQARTSDPLGVGTYGAGLSTFAVLPLSRGLARNVLRRLDAVEGRAAVATPLVNALVLRRDGRSYLLAGTVPAEVLDRAAASLVAEPPPFLGRRGR